jgi:DNA repair photolyase
MAHNAAQHLAIKSRQNKVAELYLAGHRTAYAIAPFLPEVDRRTISNDLRTLREEWKRQMADRYNDALAQELVRIDLIEQEAWSEWERSKTDREKRVREEGTGKHGATSKKRREREGRLGDPRYLEIVCKCMVQRVKLMGIDAASERGEKPGGVRWAGRSREEINREIMGILYSRPALRPFLAPRIEAQSNEPSNGKPCPQPPS